jgi:hypothetical protein
MNEFTIQRCPHDKENPYAQISRDLIRDESISPECRWLIIYLLSMSDNWSIRIKQLIAHLKPHIGRDKVYRLINQAIEAGYMKKEIDREGNLNRGIRYFVSESPKFKKTSRLTEIPDSAIGNTADKHYKKEHKVKKENTEKKQQQAPKGAKVCDAAVAFFRCIEEIGLSDKEKSSLMKYPEDEVKQAVAFATHPETKIRKSLISTIIWAIKAKPDIPETIDPEGNREGAMECEFTLGSKSWVMECLSKVVLFSSKSPTNCTAYEIRYDEPKFNEKLEKMLKQLKFVPQDQL